MVKTSVAGAVVAGCLLMMVSGIYQTTSLMDIVRIIQTRNPSAGKTFTLMSPIGSIIGCFIFCLLAEVNGRQYTLPSLGLPFIFSFTICQCSYSDNYTVLCIGKMIGGLSVGGAFAVLPLYIAEIAGKRSRGTLIALLNSSFVLGYSVVEEILKLTPETRVRSVVNYGAVLISILSTLIFGAIAIASPYYIKRGRKIKAIITVTKTRNQHCNIKLELDDLQGKAKERLEHIENPERIMPYLKVNRCIRAVLMMLGLVTLQCFSGITDFAVYFSFACEKFSLDPKLMPFLINFWVVITATLCPSLVDRIGRKLCLMLSYTGIAASLTLLLIVNAIKKDDISWYLVIFIGVLFYTSFNIGATAIPLVLIGELFALRTKMIASAVITGISYSLQLSYFSVHDFSSAVWMYINIFCSIICVIFVKFYVLETKDKSLNEIQLALTQTKGVDKGTGGNYPQE